MSTTVLNKPKVFTLEPLHSDALALAREHFDLVLPSDPHFASWREEAEGLLARNAEVTAKDVAVLKQNRLKYIAKQGVGVDNFDLPSLRTAGIPLMNTPGINAIAVAEMALSLILDVARSVTKIDRDIRGGRPVTKLHGWHGQILNGKVLGVVGGGNIGLAVGRMFSSAFQGSIILYDPFIGLEQLIQWKTTIPQGRFRVVDTLDLLLVDSDVVTLHCPLNHQTRDLISTRELSIMKKTAILINTARGGVINEPALEAALRNEEIYGAGLDAFVIEPPTQSAYGGLCQLDNVVMTPHFGATPQAVQQETCRSMVEHLVEAFQGQPLRDRVV